MIFGMHIQYPTTQPTIPRGHMTKHSKLSRSLDSASGRTSDPAAPEIRKGVVLKLSEWGRPIVYIAESSWYSGVTTNQCVFSSREEAVRWAKDQGREFVDWNTWAPRGKYPDCEFDSEQFDPTFFAKWDDGFVRVIKTEVNENKE